MQTRIISRFDHQGLADLRAAFAGQYGTIEQLRHQVEMVGCGNPDLVDDLEIWRALTQPEASFVQVEEIASFEIFNHLTARKMEILDFLRHYSVKSIRDLAEHLKRDYKRVYEDLRALREYNLVTMVREGKNQRPVCLVTDVEIEV